MSTSLARLADDIWPFLAGKVAAGSSRSGASSSGGMVQHDLAGGYHSGTLRNDQAPQFLLLDGSRTLTGNLAVAAGVTIDGVDLSELALSATHARKHALNSDLDHFGTLDDSQAPQFLLTNGSRMLTGNLAVADGVTIDGADISELAKLSHARLHDLASPDDHKGLLPWAWLAKAGSNLADVETRRYPDLQARQHEVAGADHALTGPAWSVPGATATNTLGLLLARNDVSGTVQEALLRSDAAGAVKLRAAEATIKLRSPILDTESGNLDLRPATGVTTGSQIFGFTRLRSPILDSDDGITLRVQPGQHLDLAPQSNLVRLVKGVALQSEDYASQTTGVRVGADGQGDFRYLYSDEMQVKLFTAINEQVLAGAQMVTKSSATTGADFVAPTPGGTSTLTVKDWPGAPGVKLFEGGDFVALKQMDRSEGGLTVAYCWGTVGAYTNNGDGTQSWTFTRSSDGLGYAMVGVTAVASGAEEV